MTMKTNRIAFQGEFGANSDMASRDMFPTMEPLPCQTFEDALLGQDAKAREGKVADLGKLLAKGQTWTVSE